MWQRRPLRRHRARRPVSYDAAESLEVRLYASASTALGLDGVPHEVRLDPAEPVQKFQFSLTDSGRWTASLASQVGTGNSDTTLSLWQEGKLLAQSDDAGIVSRDPRLDLHLTPGTYELLVGSTPPPMGVTVADLTTGFVAATPLFTDVSVGPFPEALTTADFNGDGLLDIATADTNGIDPGSVTILLGVGDGTFRPQAKTYPVRRGPRGIAAADFNGDGHPDLAVANTVTDDLTILIGDGQGEFSPLSGPVSGQAVIGDGPINLVATDLDNDGTIDLLVANTIDNNLGVLKGTGDGRFVLSAPLDIGVGNKPLAIVLEDFDLDGRVDIAVGNRESASLSLLWNQGGLAFVTQVIPLLAAADARLSYPLGLAGVDGDGDGKRDLAVLDRDNSRLVFLENLGGRGFLQRPSDVVIDVGSTTLVAADFDGDGRVDLATASADTNQVLMHLNAGGWLFSSRSPVPTGRGPTAAVAGDFDLDGRLDLVTANLNDSSITVLPGLQDGARLDVSPREPTGLQPVSLASADFDGDGRLDLVTANQTGNSLTVLLGDGSLGFESQRLKTGSQPSQAVTGDINRDGRPDIVVANLTDQTLQFFFGLGDGTFREGATLEVLQFDPTKLILDDLDGDGTLDLAVISNSFGVYQVFRGLAGGEFEATSGAVSLTETPNDLAVVDFNHDGRKDLVFACATGSLLLLQGQGNGLFETPERLDVGIGLTRLLALDLDRDGIDDLAVIAGDERRLWTLRGLSTGGYTVDPPLTMADTLLAIGSGDFNGDGAFDLLVTTGQNRSVTLLTNRTSGPGAPFVFEVLPQVATVGSAATSLFVGDFNQDGRDDFVTANSDRNDVSIAAGFGDGQFFAPSVFSNLANAAPFLADLTGDGVADLVSLTSANDLLLRLGRGGDTGGYLPALRLIAGSAGGARSFAVLPATTAGTPSRIAVISRSAQSVAILTLSSDGSVATSSTIAAPAGAFLSDIHSADLEGDGRTELFVTDAGRGRLLVFRQGSDGRFALDPVLSLPTGNGPTRVLATNLNQRGGLDLLVTNQVSADATLYYDVAARPNQVEFRPPMTTGKAQLATDLSGAPGLVSSARLDTVLSADFNGDGLADLASFDTRSRTLFVSLAKPSGQFFAPMANFFGIEAVTFVTAQLTDDNGDGTVGAGDRADIVLLNAVEGVALVLLGQADGTFVVSADLPVGVGATGLTLVDAGSLGGGGSRQDGVLDLLVGNQRGDVLTFLGNRDGTFVTPVRASSAVPLVVLDVNGDGIQDVVLANQSRDRIQVDYGVRKATDGTTDALASQRLSQGLVAPGAVAMARLDPASPASTSDMLVANSGSNSVSVYRQLADGTYGPAESYFTGQSPAGITVADINADTFPDLIVANQGSNDVTILLGGRTADGQMTFTNGPRLNVGAGNSGPIATLFQDANNDGVPDLVVTNSGSGTVSLLSGTGGGFFNDTAPPTITTGVSAPVVTIPGGIAGVSGIANSFFAIANLATAFSQGDAFTVNLSSSGGIRPGSILMNDLGGGLFDLIVANAGDGRIVLIDGATLALKSSLTRDGLLSPSAMALATVDGALSLLVTDAGEEVVTIFDLTADQSKDDGGDDSSDPDVLRELLSESTFVSTSSDSTRTNPLQSFSFYLGSSSPLGQFLIEVFGGRNSAGGMVGLLRVVVWARQATVTVFTFFAQIGRLGSADSGSGATARTTLAVQTVTRGPQVLTHMLATPGGVGVWSAQVAAWLLATVPENEQSSVNSPTDGNVAQVDATPTAKQDADKSPSSERPAFPRPGRVQPVTTGARVRPELRMDNRKLSVAVTDRIAREWTRLFAVPVVPKPELSGWHPAEDNPRRPVTARGDRLPPAVPATPSADSAQSIDWFFRDAETVIEAMLDMPRPKEDSPIAPPVWRATLGWAGLVLALCTRRVAEKSGMVSKALRSRRRRHVGLEDDFR
jgi:hypothetical protein